MKLSDLFGQSEQKISNTTIDKTTANDPKQNYRLQQQIKALKPGQTLQGEVVGRNGNEVLIKVGEDFVLTAKMDKELNVELGKIMTFEVKSSGGQTLALSPLFENMGTDANVLKALDMAGLPINNTTISMAESMMAEGLSIDKSSLTTMFKNMINNPQASPRDLVILNRLGVEITPENLQQLQNYQNLQHQIVKDTTHILDELSFQFKSLMQAGDKEGAMKLFTAALELLNNQSFMPEGTPSQDLILPGENSNGSLGETGYSNQNTIQQTIESPINHTITGENVTQETIIEVEEFSELKNAKLLANEEENVYNVNGRKNTVESSFERQPLEVTNEKTGIEPKINSATITSVLSETEIGNLTQQLKTMGVADNILASVKDGTIDIGTLMKYVAQLISVNKGANQDGLLQLFSGKEFQTLLKTELAAQWTISPAEGLNKKNIDTLYQRLKTQLSSLEETLSQIIKTDSPLSKSVSNLQNNLEFMQQLNQTFTYLQLPLKMSGGKAHGDLYVYTNKRSLAQKDGKVSALLHLDMEHLGPVDIYVAMENQKVNTHFYLQDDRILSFIEENIHILNQRLEKRGYSMNCEMSVKEGSKKIIDEMLRTEKGVAKISQYSFDVRA